MTGAEILIRIDRLIRVLQREDIDVSRLEYKVVREEWSDLIRHMQHWGNSSSPAFDVKYITYLDIKIRNPDAPVA